MFVCSQNINTKVNKLVAIDDFAPALETFAALNPNDELFATIGRREEEFSQLLVPEEV